MWLIDLRPCEDKLSSYEFEQVSLIVQLNPKPEGHCSETTSIRKSGEGEEVVSIMI